MSLERGRKVVSPKGYKGKVFRVSSCGRYALIVWSTGEHSSHPVGEVEKWIRATLIRRAADLKWS